MTSQGVTSTDKVVLDSWPVIEAAKGLRHVTSKMGTLFAEQRPVMSAVNYAEVYSSVLMGGGIVEARNTVGRPCITMRSCGLETPSCFLKAALGGRATFVPTFWGAGNPPRRRELARSDDDLRSWATS